MSTKDGRVYLEHGRRVTVLASSGKDVLIRRDDGTTATRPFAGLRRVPNRLTADQPGLFDVAAACDTEPSDPLTGAEGQR
jgi:hypothetical protein